MTPDRRSKPTLRETLTFTKEIPLVWLLTILVGGVANFTVIVWSAATLVSTLNTHSKEIDTLQRQTSANTTLIAAQSVMLQTQQVQLAENKENLRYLLERFNRYSERK